MRRLLPWVLLSLSLLANAGFVAGYLALHERAQALIGDDGRPNEAVSEILRLDPAQVALLEQAQALAVRNEGDRDSFRRLYVGALLAPAFDRDALFAAFQARSTERNAQWARVAEALHAFVQSLRPDQRAIFAETAGDDWGFLKRLVWPASDSSR